MSPSPTLECSPEPKSPAPRPPASSEPHSARALSLRETIRAIARALDQAYSTLERSDEASAWLRDNRTFIRAQVKDVKESLTKKFCGRLPRGGWPVYELLAGAISERATDLNTRAIARLLEPECL